MKSDVFSFLEKNTRKFDIIFADPPYDMEQERFERLVSLVFDKNLLHEDGILIVEHGKQTELSGLPNFEQARKYGGNVFSFFKA